MLSTVLTMLVFIPLAQAPLTPPTLPVTPTVAAAAAPESWDLRTRSLRVDDAEAIALTTGHVWLAHCGATCTLTGWRLDDLTRVGSVSVATPDPSLRALHATGDVIVLQTHHAVVTLAAATGRELARWQDNDGYNNVQVFDVDGALYARFDQDAIGALTGLRRIDARTGALTATARPPPSRLAVTESVSADGKVLYAYELTLTAGGRVASPWLVKAEEGVNGSVVGDVAVLTHPASDDTLTVELLPSAGQAWLELPGSRWYGGRVHDAGRALWLGTSVANVRLFFLIDKSSGVVRGSVVLPGSSCRGTVAASGGPAGLAVLERDASCQPVLRIVTLEAPIR